MGVPIVRMVSAHNPREWIHESRVWVECLDRAGYGDQGAVEANLRALPQVERAVYNPFGNRDGRFLRDYMS